MSEEVKSQPEAKFDVPETKGKMPEVKATPIAPPEVKYLLEADPKKSHEERIMAFLAKRSGTFRFNDFLKSLYPLPVRGAQPEYENQMAAKRLRILLEKLVMNRVISITGDAHRKLGTFYYDGNDASQKTQYYGLNKVPLEVTVI
jgi:hypothetical protein